MSRRSQLSRLRSLLAAHGLLQDGEAAIPDRPVELSAAEHTDLLETLQYLIRAHGARTVSPLFASALKGTQLTEEGGSNARDKIISRLKIGMDQSDSRRAPSA